MLKKLKSTGLIWFWIAIVVFIFDRITKFFIQKYLIAYSPVYIFNFFNLTLAYNKGAAFSFLDKYSGWQVWLFGMISVVVSAILLVWMSRLSAKQRWLSIALALVIGGALGNLADRLLFGHVIDFLQFHLNQLYWPAFNIADSAICVGAFMLFWDALFFSKK